MASETAERPYKKVRLFGSLHEIITLVVGEGDNSESFAVHQNVLCDSSPFFKAACKPEWMTADDRIIKLPEDNPTAVQAMIYWIYHNQICIPAGMEGESGSGHLENDGMDLQWGLFVRLYVLGQKYQISKLQNDAVDAMLGLREPFYLPLGVVPYAYRNTMPGSPLRSLLIDIARYELRPRDFEDWKEICCTEFLFDVTKSYLCDRDLVHFDGWEEMMRSRLEDDFCRAYHDHGVSITLPCVKLRKFRTASKIDSD